MIKQLKISYAHIPHEFVSRRKLSRIYSNDNCVKIVIYAMITGIFTMSNTVDDEEEEKVKRLSW